MNQGIMVEDVRRVLAIVRGEEAERDFGNIVRVDIGCLGKLGTALKRQNNGVAWIGMARPDGIVAGFSLGDKRQMFSMDVLRNDVIF